MDRKSSPHTIKPFANFAALRYTVAMNRFTVKFAFLQGFYWVSSCFVYAFAERFLTAYGFGVQQVGFVMASANAAALLLQPLLADLADRPRGPSLRSEVCACVAAAIACAVGLLFADRPLPLIAVLFGALSTMSLTVQPMLNAVGFHYIDRGETLDYSLARGIASGAFALWCYAAGFLAEWRTESLLWAYILASLGLLAVTLNFAPGKTVSTAQKATGAVALLKKHPYLLPFLCGTVLTFTTHNFINAYMLSIMSCVGAGTHEMSVAIALAAVMEIPTMAGFSRLTRRFRLETLLLCSFVAFAVKHLLLLLPLYGGAGVWAIYLSQGVQLLGYALFIPAASFFLNERMDETDKVKGQMLITECISLSCILGQLGGGYSIAGIGVPLTMLVGCGLSVVGLALAASAVRKKILPKA